MELKDKVVVVTGSSSGIGRATALEFAKEGAKVVVNCKSNLTGAKRVVEEIEKLGTKAFLVQANLEQPSEVKKLFKETVKQFGTVDVLVNNHGLAAAKPFLEITRNDLIEEFDRNFFSYLFCTQEAARIMQKRKQGKIINVSSICALTGCTTVLTFSTARAAVNCLTKALAKILAPDINVNAVAPGFTLTRFWDGASKKEVKDLLDTTLTKKWVTPEQIALSIVLLAKNDAITGQIMVVDAGYTGQI